MEKHAIIRGWIQKGFLKTTGIACPWDGSEGQALDRMLKANPSWSVSDWGNMLANYFRSERVNGDRPRLWIPNISRYAGGWLDQYGVMHPRKPLAWCEICAKKLGECEDGEAFVCSEECRRIYGK
jgi:hypothetical protein